MSGRPAGELWSRRSIAVAVATLAAAVAGATVGSEVRERGSTAHRTDAREKIGPLQLSLPPGWTASAGRSPIPGLEDGRVIRAPASSATVAVGPVESGTLLPSALAAATHGAPPVTTSGTVRMWAYDVALPGARAAAVMTAPTTAGVVTLACWTDAALLEWAAADCGEIAARMRLEPPAAWIAPQPDTAVRLGLPSIVRQLNERRESARAALRRASSAEGRGGASAALADAYADAARDVAPLTGATHHRVPRRLARISDAYAALTAASAQRRRLAALRAGAAITRGERRLQRELTAFAA